jgi:hypothetical protein
MCLEQESAPRGLGFTGYVAYDDGEAGTLTAVMPLDCYGSGPPAVAGAASRS